jgi:hypothetical protein
MNALEIETLNDAIEMLNHLDYSNIEIVIDDISVVTESLIDLLINESLKNDEN